MRKNTLLLILDGWGYREEKENNAIAQAKVPNWNKLWSECPKRLIMTSGLAVGLPEGQMGNSEVGHTNLGAGRVVFQTLTEIDMDIEKGQFGREGGLPEVLTKIVSSGKALHIWGLLSDGGVHSHINHIHALITQAAKAGVKKIYLHAFLDGRDTPPNSAKDYIASTEALFAKLGTGRIASVVGRYFAMDRDKRWERLEKAYRLIVDGQGEFSASSALSAVDAAYSRGETDEFVKATSIAESVKLAEGDTVIFMNFRADRARQLTRIFVDPSFKEFATTPIKIGQLITLMPYADDLPVPTLYKPKEVINGLGEYLSKKGKKQLRIAETEKYAHVTFFFSCGREELYEGEERILVPSPKVATYDLQPEMSVLEVTDKLVAAIESEKFDTIICNFANGDMVGHTGILSAAIKAAEAVDAALGRLMAALKAHGGQMLVCADHGNMELMWDYENNCPHTQHTTLPVPLVYFGDRAVQFSDEIANLSSISPTLLDLMDEEKPAEMTSKSLIISK